MSILINTIPMTLIAVPKKWGDAAVGDAIGWLSYVHGGEYSNSADDDDFYYFRSDYQCW